MGTVPACHAKSGVNFTLTEGDTVALFSPEPNVRMDSKDTGIHRLKGATSGQNKLWQRRGGRWVFPHCGSGIIESYPQVTITEQCDDGNYKSGDGCSSECSVEDGWHCYGGLVDGACDPSCDGASDKCGSWGNWSWATKQTTCNCESSFCHQGQCYAGQFDEQCNGVDDYGRYAEDQTTWFCLGGTTSVLYSCPSSGDNEPSVCAKLPCNICKFGLVDPARLAGYRCYSDSESILGDSRGPYTHPADGVIPQMDTADACSAAGGHWIPYTCGDVQNFGYTMFPGNECDGFSYFWHSIVPMDGSDPVTCCADPDKSAAAEGSGSGFTNGSISCDDVYGCPCDEFCNFDDGTSGFCEGCHADCSDPMHGLTENGKADCQDHCGQSASATASFGSCCDSSKPCQSGGFCNYANSASGVCEPCPDPAFLVDCTGPGVSNTGRDDCYDRCFSHCSDNNCPSGEDSYCNVEHGRCDQCPPNGCSDLADGETKTNCESQCSSSGA